MKKIFTRSLCICMMAALIINIAVVALIQMVVMEQTHTQSSYERLEAVKETLAKNDENIAQLKQSLGKNNLAKSMVLAYICRKPLISLGLRGIWKVLYTTFTQLLPVFLYCACITGNSFKPPHVFKRYVLVYMRI